MAKTITALKQQKRDPQRVNVYLDGEFAFGLAKILAAWLQVGETLGERKIGELQNDDALEKAYQRALNFLGYRPRSTAEVERNLRKHKVAEGAIEAVLSRLGEKGLLDDLDFALAWVENRNTFRPRSHYALRAELRQKGVKDEIIDQALEDVDEEALVRQAAQRKARQLEVNDWASFRKKLSAHLARRGFSYQLAADACKEAWDALAAGARESKI